MKNILLIGCFFGLASAFLPATLQADELTSTADSSTRYGLFNGLDHRSQYGQGIFPEPFLVDDSDLEVNEARLDWLHARAGGAHSDEIKAEVEKGFGLMTVELEVPYVRESADGEVTKGFANIDVGARYPFYQYVSPHSLLDTTFGAAVELGIPTTSPVSKNTEFVPKIFNDLKVGEFTLQSLVGYSTLFGPGEEGGAQVFEYGLVFGYSIQHRVLPLPGVQQLIPVFELSGETGLNHGESGHNSLLGNAAFRLNLDAIGRVQPRLGFGYVFPIDSNAREELHYGFFTSLVFEY
jgi:hypothetical protein